MSRSLPQITQDDLRPGDVLLSCGKQLESKLICAIAGGDYSHAGLWDGTRSIDASANGVHFNQLADVLAKQEYVDAYRWHGNPPPPHHLDEDGYPSAPVTYQADQIVKQGTAFAYDELLMAALVIAVSQKPTNPVIRALARVVLSKVDEWIHTHITGTKKRAMMCTQVVCTSYWEAKPNPQYAIYIKLGAARAANLVAVSGPRPLRASHHDAALDDVSDDVYESVQAECARLVLQAGGPQLRRTVQGASQRVLALPGGGPIVTPAGGPLVPLGCVSPWDLETSPSLDPVGRLAPGVPKLAARRRARSAKPHRRATPVR